MRVYTIQNLEVYNQLLQKNKFIASKKNIMEKNFQSAYDWLVAKAIKYKKWKGKPHNPIWLWTTKPDLRSHRFIYDSLAPKQIASVLLTLEIPDNLILLSEFGLWHNVLNHYPIFYNTKDEKLHKNIKNLNQNWERCLFLKDDSFKKFSSNYIYNINLQGITPFLKKEYIISVKKFKIVNKFHF